MKLSLIVAMATNRTIGINKKMPWHLSADLKQFKKITLGHPIIMGRKTFESIGRPLPGRQNIIISRDINYQQEGCLVFNNLDTALQYCSDQEAAFVIGGATLYEVTLEHAEGLYITQIHKSFKGDTWFPEIDAAKWREVKREDINDDASVDFKYSFICYDRI